MSYHKTIHEININAYLLVRTIYPWLVNVPKQWHQIVQFLESYTPKISCKVIHWRKLEINSYKCNTDGNSKSNPGSCVAAYCIRDWDGNMRYAAAKRIQDGSSIMAEGEKIRFGLEHCIQNQYMPFEIETDSLAMKKILDEEWDPPWSIVLTVQLIVRMRRSNRVLVTHMMREGNQMTNFLTNLGGNFAGTLEYKTFQELPGQGKAIIRADKEQIPYLRIRRCKNPQYSVS